MPSPLVTVRDDRDLSKLLRSGVSARVDLEITPAEIVTDPVSRDMTPATEKGADGYRLGAGRPNGSRTAPVKVNL